MSRELVSIKVRKELRDRLHKERDDFQAAIGGGRWSISDALNEIFKIADSTKEK